MGNYASEYYAEDAVFPTAAQVLSAITFGMTGANLTGTLVVPSISDVRDGTFFGASSALEGTLVVPDEIPTPAAIATAVWARAGRTLT